MMLFLLYARDHVPEQEVVVLHHITDLMDSWETIKVNKSIQYRYSKSKVKVETSSEIIFYFI